MIIGSTAIKYWYPDFKREPKDLDIAVISKEGHDNIEGKEYLENPILIGWYEDSVCPPNGLLTLKVSHLMYDLNWNKHLHDAVFLFKKGCVVEPILFEQLMEYWKTIHGANKRSDLKMSKDEFFTNAVNYDTHEHDHIHTILNPTPMYTKLLKDGCEVELDQSKWERFSVEEKLETVREEIYVMAWERFKRSHYIPAYRRMFKKFIISHAPTFMLTFIIENYVELERPKINFIEHINKRV